MSKFWSWISAKHLYFTEYLIPKILSLYIDFCWILYLWFYQDFYLCWRPKSKIYYLNRQVHYAKLISIHCLNKCKLFNVVLNGWHNVTFDWSYNPTNLNYVANLYVQSLLLPSDMKYFHSSYCRQIVYCSIHITQQLIFNFNCFICLCRGLKCAILSLFDTTMFHMLYK